MSAKDTSKIMENENENLNSLNEEYKPEDVENLELGALKEKYQTLSDKHTKVTDTNRQLFERAKKAEGFEKVDGKWVKPQKPEPKKSDMPDVPVESDEPDYGRLAFLNSSNVNHPDDQKAVMDEAKRLKLPLTDVLQMEHIKTRLQANKEDRELKAGMPRGRDRSGGSTPQDVDYHLAKGTTPDEQELAEKVVEARMKREEQKSKFSDILFNENL